MEKHRLTRTFFTYCDQKYAARGLAAVDSLRRFDSKGRIRWVALDRSALATVHLFDHFRVNPILFPVCEGRKRDRTLIWRQTARIFLRILKNTPPGSWTIYFDADVLFLSDPDRLLRRIEKSGKSFFVSPHDYAPEYNDSASRGKYCVQFVAVKNNPVGREFCGWWDRRIQEGCTDQAGPGFGDQKCLDEIPGGLRRHQFDRSTQGLFAAPWNARRWDAAISTRKSVLYHFQGFRFVGRFWYIQTSRYRLGPAAQKLYRTYAAQVAAFSRTLEILVPRFARPCPGENFFPLRLLKRVILERTRLGWVS